MKLIILFLFILFSSCSKDRVCYEIQSYVMKKVTPSVYEVTAVNLNKTITYTTRSLPMVGNQICF